MKSLSKMILIIGALPVTLMGPASADENALEFFLSCNSAVSECQRIQFESGELIDIKKVPEMTLSQSDVDEAEIVTGPYQERQLQITLKQGPADRLAQITRNNIGQSLVVVSAGRALMAPQIHESITGGRFVMSADLIQGHDFLERLPWLKRMSDEKQLSNQRWRVISLASYVFLGLLVLGGAVFFAFFKKEKPLK